MVLSDNKDTEVMPCSSNVLVCNSLLCDLEGGGKGKKSLEFYEDQSKAQEQHLQLMGSSFFFC